MRFFRTSSVAIDKDLADFFLGRLTSLVARQATTADPKERIMLAQAAFSIFLDCQDLGLENEALAIVGRPHAVRAEQAA